MLFLASLLAILTTASQLSSALRSGRVGERFDLAVRIASNVQAIDDDFAISDQTGAVIINRQFAQSLPVCGTHVCARGHIQTAPFGHCVAVCTNIVSVGFAVPPPVESVDFGKILSGACDARVIRTNGMLRDWFRDEIDPKYVFLILNRAGKTLYVAIARHSDADIAKLDALIGRDMTLTGLCDPFPSGSRRKIGRILRIDSLSSIDAQKRAPDSPFSAPAIDSIEAIQAFDLSGLGRRKTSGLVLAVWQGHSLLILTPKGAISRIDLAKENTPHPGDIIEVVGFPETDLYRVNFSRAVWRPLATDGTFPRPPDPTNITTAVLMTDKEDKPTIHADFHGHAVRLRGILRSLPSIGNDGRFHLESDGYTIPVDISANPSTANKLEIGSVIDVTGICVMDIENWRPNLVFPHIKEVMIVTRTPDDIVIVSRPPWWTQTRLLIVIGSLFAVLLGILVWNRALQTLAHKRGKALANEELKRLEADLKVCERTRLAVELHDSIAQNLTGVSMEIDTALRGDEPLPATAARHIGRALRTIDSCRGELRNCLWDLRNQALEETDMNKAIRLTLSQMIGKANLNVRFNVPRSRFTDNTAHTILRIIRELAANAVRHGKATEIKVAGSIENDMLKFSVRDNGCGFDPDTCPGVLDGHFGLVGVRERVASFEGNVQIESALGKGTKIVVSINTPPDEDEAKI